MTPEQQEEETIDSFEKTTYAQVRLWDWIGRVVPWVALLIIAACYFFKWKIALEFTIESIAIMFGTLCFIWWWWALFKIAVAIKYIRTTHDKFTDLRNEFQTIKEFFKNTSNKDMD
jgi:hypothetical protein